PQGGGCLAYWLEGVPARPGTPGHRLRRERSEILRTSRARLRLSLFVALGAIGVLGFVIFPPHRLSIRADGSDIDVVSRQQNVATLLNVSGVKEQAGDVLVRSGTELAVQRAVPVIVHADGQTLFCRTRS